MNYEFHWGWLIVFYLFLAGVSAGAFATSGLANYLGGKKYEQIARIGAYIAPFPVMIGTSLLLFDLGNPLRFWRLFVTVQWTSPMSIGSWLLTFFITISLIYFFMWLPAPIHRLVKLPQSFSTLLRVKEWKPLNPTQIRKWKLILAGIGFPISIGVGMYTGILLGAIPARPFWNTPMVAQLFLFSAMSTGVGSILFTISVRKNCRATVEEIKLLNSVDAALILFEFFLIIPFILHQKLSTWSHAESVKLIMGGHLTELFWIGVILLGLIIPLLIETWELYHIVVMREHRDTKINLAMLSGGLVIIGGFILRFIFVFAGQMSHFLPVAKF